MAASYNYDIDFCRKAIDDVGKEISNGTIATNAPITEKLEKIILMRAFAEDLDLHEGYTKMLETIAYMLRNHFVEILQDGKSEGELFIPQESKMISYDISDIEF
jgi:hypothetical protein